MSQTIFVVPPRLEAIGYECAQIFSHMKVEKTTRKKKPALGIFVAIVPAQNCSCGVASSRLRV